MGKSRDPGNDPQVDPVEKRLAAARERLREAHERLNTREHAIIPATRPSNDDDPPRTTVPRKK